MKELCFLCGPYRDVVNKGEGLALSVDSSVRESVKEDLRPEAKE
jgi:hypothetical protein